MLFLDVTAYGLLGHVDLVQVELWLSKNAREVGACCSVPGANPGAQGFPALREELQCSCYVKHQRSKYLNSFCYWGTLGAGRLCHSFFISSLYQS